ncbi:hypothetical protein GS429_08735 [Natronorubrum sp. JWXQ-INN-674]|uniref:Uncharacterized protein n=1 Tax=Natronorubrum halalkaliphilum TaxID=2691917 RepID=A0A6B0VLX2_9EURY|nr:hypothetical protein [Natronorubrum halalkaliphilum]MXV62145.1 hypothetical protein [Natronorubrum halalkaliphilum]
MVDIDTDAETDLELGKATIVYETPTGDLERATVDNDRIAYFQGHWLFAYGTDADGNDVVRRVPRERVRLVERSVEEIEERFETAVDKTKGKLEDLVD